jgi:hypothetical protein
VHFGAERAGNSAELKRGHDAKCSLPRDPRR